jgi:hypothetical protein
MDVGLIRKLAAKAAGERAFADLTREDDTSLDQVLLQKAASAEDPDLFRIAMRMPGDPMKNYEALGGQYKVAYVDPISLTEEQAAEDEVLKQAFGQPMFSAAPAPDPKLEAASLSSPSPSSSGPTGPKAPSASSGPSGGGSSAGSPKVQSVPEPSVPGAGVSAGAGGGMG